VSVPDEDYSNPLALTVPDEDYSNPLTLSVPDEDYSEACRATRFWNNLHQVRSRGVSGIKVFGKKNYLKIFGKTNNLKVFGSNKTTEPK
jgi:hypothetical protein